MSFDIYKYREMFLEEAEDLFESANNILIEAEANDSLTDDEMGQLFRDIHTLKGSGASVELTLFAEFAHDLESLMDKLRNHKIKFIPEMADKLIDSVDVMKEILDLEMSEDLTRETFTYMTSELLVKIREYSSSDIVSIDNIVIEENGANKDIDYLISSEAYGFFDENLNIFLEIKDNTSENNQSFGFFDDVSEIKPDSVMESNNSTQKEILDKIDNLNKKVKNQSTLTEEVKTSESQKESKKVITTNNIRVNLDKIDLLMNNVGDLVITNAMLTQFTSTITDVKTRNSVLERLDLLERHIREMQDTVMSIRMVPMKSIYSKFPKVVRDIAKKLNKKVEFKHFGDEVEIDKVMIEGLTDPLMHIIRNSLDHGIEAPEIRLSSGKNDMGTISISAEQSNGQMIITIKDDGNGIDGDRVAIKALENGLINEKEYDTMSEKDKAMLVFGAGITTSNKVTEISGRGVGMDVVKTNIHKLGGVIDLSTKLGTGTTIKIILPLTLAILDGLDIKVGNQKYILPLNSIVESLQPTSKMIKKIGDNTQELLILREEFIPVVRLHDLFGVQKTFDNLENGILIVVKSGSTKVALSIDEFLSQHQIVVKSLDKNFRSIKGIEAATVRGDGSIGLILDVLGIISLQLEIDRS